MPPVRKIIGLEDLPNDVLGEILRRAEGFDKIRLTQASPLIRRLSKGPQAAPGVLGLMTLLFDRRRGPGPAISPVRLFPVPVASLDVTVSLDVDLTASPHPLEPLLVWVSSRARAFSSAVVVISDDPIEGKVLRRPPYRGFLASLLGLLLPSAPLRFEAFVRHYPLHSQLRVDDALMSSVGKYSERLHRVIKKLRKDLPPLESAEVSVSLTNPSAAEPWPSDAFAWASNLSTFTLRLDPNIKEVESTISNIKHSLAWTKLRVLDLQGFPKASFSSLCDSMAASPLPALETININFEAFERSASPGLLLDGPALVKLSNVLQNLPTLSSLSLIGFRDALTPNSQPPLGLSIELPTLTKLHLGLLVGIGANRPREKESFPLRFFSCPRAHTLSLSAFCKKSQLMNSVCGDCLAGFPSLERLFCDARDAVFTVGNGQLVFDLRGVDFRDTPRLSFLQIFASGFILPHAPRHVPLPLTASDVAKSPHTGMDNRGQTFAWDSVAQLVEFGDGDGPDPESKVVEAELDSRI